MTTSQMTPRVTGRHRNRALAAARRRQAVELALSGATYQRIAEEMGYASRGTVYRIVQQALTRAEAETIDELRELELKRLDALQSAYWERAVCGDLQAAAVVIRVIDRRCRLLALYAASQRLDRCDRTGPVVPMIVDPADLVACRGWPVDGWARNPTGVDQD